MSIDHVLAVVPVRDLAEAVQWYTSLFGREPDNRPMVNLAEWRVTETGWVQVTVDASRAGQALLNFAVDDLTTHREAVGMRGLTMGAVVDANKGVQLSSIGDPDGNTLTFIGGFRIHY
ncbi:VOC family protein [Rhodococcus sp. KBS0724]|uniref:VOC family protein n=1 Tax=Rhodococcus sp. KBS0724 TaxID=1179674 RepID=UPI00110D985E|nr:VOC family protein [Rhodococcus sp. KBS0724]TSD50379.1 VOC family protein [Rhodococcus sp. KBS0724]